MGYQECIIKCESKYKAQQLGASINRILMDPVHILVAKHDVDLAGCHIKKYDVFLMVAGERSEMTSPEYWSLDDLCYGESLYDHFYINDYESIMEKPATNKQTYWINCYKNTGKISQKTLQQYYANPNRTTASYCLEEAFCNK